MVASEEQRGRQTALEPRTLTLEWKERWLWVVAKLNLQTRSQGAKGWTTCRRTRSRMVDSVFIHVSYRVLVVAEFGCRICPMDGKQRRRAAVASLNPHRREPGFSAAQ